MFSSSVADAPLIREPLHAPVAHLIRGGVVEGIHYGSVVVLGADGTVQLPARRHRGRVLPPIGAQARPGRRHGPGRTPARRRAALARRGQPLRRGTPPRRDAADPGTRRAHRGRICATSPTCRSTRPSGTTGSGRAARPPGIAQNCSGKHAAMLYTCELNGWSLDDYLDPGHPLQQAIAEIVEDLTGQRIAQVTVDGCGAPLFSVSLHGLARAAARITTAPPGTPEARVADAMREHAEMASGSGRDVAALMRAVPGLLAKDGFEGVQVAALPDGRAVAVKIADGANRARVPVTAAALASAGVDPALLTDVRRARRCSGAAARSGVYGRCVRWSRSWSRPARSGPGRHSVRRLRAGRGWSRSSPRPRRGTVTPYPRKRTRTLMTPSSPAANTTCSATVTSPPTPTGASTPCAPRRTSPSPARRSPPTRT